MTRIVSAATSDRRVLDDARGIGAMTAVLAIMVFLTVLAAALGLGTASAARALTRDLAGRVTVQVIDADAGAQDAAVRRIDKALGALSEVKQISPVSRADLEQLLQPWLGDDAADADLPVPALIDLSLRDTDDGTLARVTAAIRAVAPRARIDRHQSWMSPVGSVMRTLTWLAVTLVVLMASATAAVVILAARAGLQQHRGTIEVMHMLGATDLQIARLFQRRIALDAMLGGAVGAAAALAMAALLQRQLTALGSELLGGAALDAGAWLFLLLLPVLFVALATAAARFAVLRALGRIL